MFESDSAAKKQIFKDKHTLLEGYVSEYLFEKQFITNKGRSCVKGCWVAVNNAKRYLFVLNSTDDSFEKQLVDFLSTQFEVWKVYNINNEWIFESNGRKYCLDAFAKHEGLIKNKPLSAVSQTRDSQRQQQCCDFFIEKGILQEVAFTRCFADDILSPYFGSVVNIDFITRNKDGKYCIIETKYKYEDHSGCFGINVGQIKLFEILHNMGCLVYNVILYNYTKNDRVSVFDFLQMSGREKQWIISEITDFDYSRLKLAPTKTSVDGKKKQGFYPVEKNKYRLLGELVY